jgi:LacI family transcriptional regulator
MVYPLLKRLGVKIGTDVKVVSCNNERSILAGLDPMPASIDLCPEDIGRRAVEQLRWRITNPNDSSKIIIEVEPQLKAVNNQ